LVVSQISGAGAQRRRRGYEAGHAVAQQRLAAGEADLSDTQPLHRDRDQAGHLAAGQQRGLGSQSRPSAGMQ
jgi:hypothetical protein